MSKGLVFFACPHCGEQPISRNEQDNVRCLACKCICYYFRDNSDGWRNLRSKDGEMWLNLEKEGWYCQMRFPANTSLDYMKKTWNIRCLTNKDPRDLSVGALPVDVDALKSNIEGYFQKKTKKADPNDYLY